MNRQIINASRQLNDSIITLPVVIHIVNPNPFSIPDAAVIAGIKDLNDAFSKAGLYAAGPGADTKIRFCIAKKDPDGGLTTGITRTTSYYGSDLNMDIEDGPLKNLIQWDPSRYINIWLIINIHGESYANYSCGVWTRLGIGGYATLPPGGNSLDGIVITGFGKLLAHEMGHYLGLYHIFQGGCTDGDFVADTPAQFVPHFKCPVGIDTCPVSAGLDDVGNFMDYTQDTCMTHFTAGQVDRMVSQSQTYRPNLWR